METWLRSRLLDDLGVPHAFTTAAAGDMKDAAARAKLLAEVAPGLPLATAKQVHGARALWGAPERLEECDALLARPGTAVGVFTADCVPILLVDPAAGLAAAVHAGWRGTIAGIASAAVRALADAGGEPARLVAAIGPHIRPCCYEVGDDLAARFADRFGAGVAVQRERPRLDLGEANRRLLREAGVAAIDAIDACTACSGDPRFFSYRREKDLSGRQISIVAVR